MTMTSPPPTALGQIDGLSAHELLSGLGRLHQFVVVTDSSGVVRWTSRHVALRMGRLEGGVGSDVTQLCIDFALSHNRT